MIPQDIFSALKQSLKHKGISYKDLADLMNSSESGIKKIMSSQDCNLSKLMEICRVTSISFSDLVNLADNEEPQVLTINKRQNDFFLLHTDCYYFFLSLVRHDYEISDIQCTYKLSNQQVEKYLLALDQLDLIILKPDHHISPVIKNISGIEISKELDQLVSEHNHRKIVEYAYSSNIDDSLKLKKNRINLYLSEKSRDDFLQSIHELMTSFSKRSRREVITHGKKSLHNITGQFIVVEDFVLEEAINLEYSLGNV